MKRDPNAPPDPPGTGSQRGSVLLLLVVIGAVAMALVVQVGRLGAHAVAQARAEAAADAAALAAADALALGRGADAAVAVAVETAAANGARLDPARCDCTGRVVTVEVTVGGEPAGSSRSVRIAGFVGTATARARAEIRPHFDVFAR